MIWTFVSSVLFDTQSKHCNGMFFSSPDGDCFVRYTTVGFVDDSTCITGGDSNDTYEELKSKMTQDAQLWHDLLYVSGGKLELPKCGYHIVYWDFDDFGIPQMKITKDNESIILQDDSGTNVTIGAKSIFQPRKNLGHYKAPGGDRSIQVSKIE